jgi:hypothetical protein
MSFGVAANGFEEWEAAILRVRPYPRLLSIFANWGVYRG